MDQEAEIFKPRGTENDSFDTLDCTRQTMKDEEVDRGSHIGRALVLL